MPCLGLLGEILDAEAGASMIEATGPIIVGLAGIAPSLALWIAVIIFAVIMLRRGGGRAERFLIAGGSIKLIGNLLGIANIFTGPWLFYEFVGTDNVTTILSGFAITRNIVSMAGLVCLLYAFWVKFKTKKEVGISP